jgi:hypothetical protein
VLVVVGKGVNAIEAVRVIAGEFAGVELGIHAFLGAVLDLVQLPLGDLGMAVTSWRARSNGVKNWDWPFSAAFLADSSMSCRISGLMLDFCSVGCSGLVMGW